MPATLEQIQSLHQVISDLEWAERRTANPVHWCRARLVGNNMVEVMFDSTVSFVDYPYRPREQFEAASHRERVIEGFVDLARDQVGKNLLGAIKELHKDVYGTTPEFSLVEASEKWNVEPTNTARSNAKALVRYRARYFVKM